MSNSGNTPDGGSNAATDPTRPVEALSPADGHAATASDHDLQSSQSDTGEDDEVDRVDLSGHTLAGRYELRRRLGSGGMGEVYLAEHLTIAKPVAIKLLGRDLVNNKGLVDRFLREARAASKIRHENVVDITDFGHTDDGVPFFAMEYLEGEELGDLINRAGRLSWQRARDLVLQILRALAAAHKHEIVHRDMKPQNCFCVEHEDGSTRVKVLDFGIAKVATPDGEGIKPLTRTGVIMGTPQYMSPEQAQSLPLDARADIYSVGIILYEMLTGVVPFRGRGFLGVLNMHVTQEPTRPGDVAPEAAIPEEIERIILKALEKDPDQRFQTAREFGEALNAVPDDSPVGVRRPSSGRSRSAMLSFAGLALGGAAIALWLGFAGNDTVAETATTAARPPVEAQVEVDSPPALPPPAPAPAVEPAQPTPPPTDTPPAAAPEPETKTSSEDGPRKARKSRRTKKSKPPKPATTSTAPVAIPLQRGSSAINSTVRKLKPKTSRCADAGVISGVTKVKATLTIEPDGSVSSVKALGADAGKRLGNCVEEALRSASFGPAEKQQRKVVTIPF